jgi:hypothetical protein
MSREHGFFMGRAWIKDYEYMDALQNRNQSLLYSILAGEDSEDFGLVLPEQVEDQELKRGKIALTRLVRQILTLSGASNLIPTSQLSRIGGIIQQAQSRLFMDMRRMLSNVSIPIERFVNDVVFQYESITKQFYTGTAIGSLVGGAIGYIYWGPIGGAIMSFLGGLAGIPFEIFHLQYKKFFGKRAAIPDNWDEMTQEELIDWMEQIWSEEPPTGGGQREAPGDDPYYAITLQTPKRRVRTILDMEKSLYQRAGGG